MFIARISKGRTIREFVLGVLLVPSLLGMFWLTVFGGTAMNLELFGGGGGVVEAVNPGTSPWRSTRRWNCCTGRPSAGLPRGADPAYLHLLHHLQRLGHARDYDAALHRRSRIPRAAPRHLGTGAGLVAAILLVSGGLAALQAASIIAALPFSVIMLAMCYS